MSLEQYKQDSELYSQYVSYKSDIDKRLRLIEKEIKSIKDDIEELEVCKVELDEDEISIINEEIETKTSLLGETIKNKDTLLNNPALMMMLNTCRSNIMSHVGKFREKNYLCDDEIKNFYSMVLDVCEITEDDIRMHEKLSNLEKENKKKTLGETNNSVPFKELDNIKYALDKSGNRIDLTGVKVFSVRFGRVKDISGYVDVTPRKKVHNKLANFSHQMFGQSANKPSPVTDEKRVAATKPESVPSTVWNGFSRESMKDEAEKAAENKPETSPAAKKRAQGGGGGGKGGGNKQKPAKKGGNPYERLRG